MKVILNDHVENLGERGDVVNVKPGYARNYLVPKGLAYPHTPGYQRLFEQEQSRWEEMDLSRRSAAEKMAEALKGVELTFERRASEQDTLFGSVSVADIHRELAERGFDIERRRVLLADSIKSLGSFEVEVQVYLDISVTVPVHVVRPGEEPMTRDEREQAAAEAEAASLGEAPPLEPASAEEPAPDGDLTSVGEPAEA